MRLMGLEPPVTMEALKRRYKELVKDTIQTPMAGTRLRKNG